MTSKPNPNPEPINPEPKLNPKLKLNPKPNSSPSPKPNDRLSVRIHGGLHEIAAEEWNALLKDNNPFLRHEFLYAMEKHGCVGETFGWIPMHLAIYQQKQLVAAMPLYLKHNSYGEFVFDQAWEAAWRRAGLKYLPKLVSAIPYTPAMGPRMLLTAGLEHSCRELFIRTAQSLATHYRASGVHWLFPDAQDLDFLQAQELVLRHDCQFHWHNQGYATFDDFLSNLTSRKRKNIRRERNKVQQAGVTLRCLNGHTASDQDWRDFSQFYNQLFEEKWGMATFNLGFFQVIAKAMPEQIVLVMAEQQGRNIAGALMYASDTHLYGRHWGCIEEVDSLHFEACYYQGIDYCIKHGVQVFEPGAQGEHKVARGFLPTQTTSAHWVAETGFLPSIRNFAHQEQQGVKDYIKRMSQQSAYRKSSQ